MNIEKSLSHKYWEEKQIDFRLIQSLSQKKSISEIFSKLLICRGIFEENYDNYIKPNLLNNLPDPFELKDMKKGISRCIEALKKNEKIGIIADYDVDGSTSISILYRFLNNFTNNLVCKIPNRLTEGYGPNVRLMNEMLNENVKLLFTLDCGTSAFNSIDLPIYKGIEVIVIDHHLSEFKLPKVHSVINPNRFDENNDYKDFAAVGVTFLFLMGLRKQIRELKLFPNIKEPNLMLYLDLVAVGTICDIVNINNYNRSIVSKGLELIKSRKNKCITKILDNSKINHEPSAKDIGFILGPQINAASRIDDSSLSSKFLISNNDIEIETISRKLFLINEKRKLIEQNIFNEAIEQIKDQGSKKFIIVYKENWHQGVLGIVASKIVAIYNKPTFVISFINDVGTGSGRSIDQIDIGNIVLDLKSNNLIEEGGGHRMAVGLKIKKNKLNKINMFLMKKFDLFHDNLFEKKIFYESEISVNQINKDFLDNLELLEPHGKGNEEPKFLIKDIVINQVKNLKNKHILIFFKNDLGENLKGISFNSVNTQIGEYLMKFNKFKFHILCSIKKDNFSNSQIPQILIHDLKVIN